MVLPLQLLSLTLSCLPHTGWLCAAPLLPATYPQVFCIPFSKSGKPGKRPPPCAQGVFEERLRLLIAQQALYQECGAEELTPKVQGGGGGPWSGWRLM
jgi:hypothetical protein